MRHHLPKRLRMLLAALAAVALIAAGCGDGDDDTLDEAVAPTVDAGQDSEPVEDADAESEGTADQQAEAPDDSAAETPDDTVAAPSEEPTEVEEVGVPDDAEPAVADGEPILVGNVSSLTGPALFPEASVAVKAVFDRVNAQGGIGGRPLQLLVEDDGGTPEGAATAGRKLVEQDNVVALVGSASVLDCAVNSAFYAEQGVYSVMGAGADPLCYLSSNISPVTTGPYSAITVSMYYASEILGLDRVCQVNLWVIPDLAPAFDAAVARWEAITGKSLALRVKAASLEDDPTPLMLQARDTGCQAVIVDGLEPHALAVGRAIEAQDLGDIVWIGLTPYYTDAIAAQLGSAGNGLRANSEFEPYNSESPVLDDWTALMTSAGIPLSSFAQGGYLAGTIFVDVLQGIDGEVTRESIAEALLAMDPYHTPLMGTPYTFGPGDFHAPNQASKFVELRDGDWVTAIDEWVILPD